MLNPTSLPAAHTATTHQQVAAMPNGRSHSHRSRATNARRNRARDRHASVRPAAAPCATPCHRATHGRDRCWRARHLQAWGSGNHTAQFHKPLLSYVGIGPISPVLTLLWNMEMGPPICRAHYHIRPSPLPGSTALARLWPMILSSNLALVITGVIHWDQNGSYGMQVGYRNARC